ncbi:MAG: FAD-dependent oxidoreductase [Planctomycetota bacterium]
MTTNVAVVGAGISGLASAVALAHRGARVVVFETDSILGGLGSTFDYEYKGAAGITKKFSLEKFYHCLLPSDAALLALLEKVGIRKEVIWHDVGMGFMENHQIYPLNGPMDLLRFSPLPILDRLRLGWMGLHARRNGPTLDLDRIRVSDWICKLAGRNVYEKLFRFLLESKLGEGAGNIPALWLASRIHREKGSNQERKGFVPGGYRAIVAAIEEYLRSKDVTIHTESPVDEVLLDNSTVTVRVRGGRVEAFDQIVIAAPFIEFQRMTRQIPVDKNLASLQLDYQGVVNCVFFLKKQLMKHYWMPIVNSGTVSQGLVELTNLVPPEQLGGLHVSYLLNYTHRSGEHYRKTDAELKQIYTKDLISIFPEANDSIVDAFVFKAPYVEPIWPLCYQSLRPSTSVVPGKVYLVSTAQVYPKINAWNSCCEVAEEMARAFVDETANTKIEAGVRVKSSNVL